MQAHINTPCHSIAMQQQQQQQPQQQQHLMLTSAVRPGWSSSSMVTL
jgi:hypothetical protein